MKRNNCASLGLILLIGMYRRSPSAGPWTFANSRKSGDIEGEMGFWVGGMAGMWALRIILLFLLLLLVFKSPPPLSLSVSSGVPLCLRLVRFLGRSWIRPIHIGRRSLVLLDHFMLIFLIFSFCFLFWFFLKKKPIVFYTSEGNCLESSPCNCSL